jgi:hypothetical protein
MIKFRASYTIISCWAKGDWERAIKMYFKLETFESEAMRQGKAYHKQWEEEVKKTGCLPKIFGGKKLNNPKTEEKMVVSVNDWLDVVGVLDLLDSPELHDYKTGKSSPNIDIQVGIYGVICKLKGIPIDVAYIHHFDQYSKKVEVHKVYLTDKKIEESMNYIITIAGEMHEYFTKNKLYEKFSNLDQL